MAHLNYVGISTVETDDARPAISEILWVPGTDIVYTSSGAFGWVSSWDWAEGALNHTKQTALLEDQASAGSTQLTMVPNEGAALIGVVGSAVDGLNVLQASNGNLTPIGADLDELSHIAWLQGNGERTLVATDDQGAALSLWTLAENGQAQKLDSAFVTDVGGIAVISGVVQFTLYDAAFVAAIDQIGNTVTLFEVTEDGFGASVQLGAKDGLAISNPTEIETVEIAGETFLIVAGSGSNSLSVIAVEEGALDLRDQVLDDRNTRFEGAGVLETIIFEDRVYIAASGQDSGFSLFTLLPDGKLLSIATLEDQIANPLDDITAMEFAVQDGVLHLLVAGEGWDGLSLIEVDTGSTGEIFTALADGGSLGGSGENDMLSGVAGNDQIYGGHGDDILTDGGGNDVLTGGSGGDVFVFSADGEADQITDFDITEDRINLSFWGRIYDKSDLDFGSIDGGIQISFADETLEVFSVNGKNLSQSQFTNAMLLDMTHVNLNTLPQTAPVQEVTENPLEEIAPDFDVTTGHYVFGSSGNDVIVPVSDNLAYDFSGAMVTRLFQAVLGREPGLEGHAVWTSRLMDKTLDGIGLATALMASTEFQFIYGDTANEEFITLLFENVLGRPPAQSGLEAWVDQLDDGRSRETVVLNFSGTPEFTEMMLETSLGFSFAVQQAAWMDDVFRLFQTTLDREPVENGLLWWSENLANGATFLSAIEGFVMGPEFQRTYGETSNNEFASLLFQNVLGRPPAEAGLTFWVERLNAGEDRAEVIAFFAQSDEFTLASRPDFVDFMKQLAPDDVILGQGGNDVLQGGGLSDVFVFDSQNSGDSVIVDFEAWDFFMLTNSAFASRTEIMDALQQHGPDVVLDFGDGSVTFLDKKLTDFDLDQFFI